MKIYTFNE
jgi:hypothetical protein